MRFRSLLICLLAAAMQAAASDRIPGMLHRLGEAPEDKSRVLLLDSIGMEYYNANGNLDSSIYYLKQGLDLSRKAGEKRAEGKLDSHLGLMYREKGVYEKALGFYLDGLRIAQQQGDSLLIGSSYNGIAVINQIQKKYDTAYAWYMKGMELYTRMKNKNRLGPLYNNIGLLYTQRGDPEKGLEFYQKSMNIAIELEDKRSIATASENMGLIYDESLNDPERALRCFDRSVGLWRSMQDENSVSITCLYKVFALKKLGRYREALDTATYSLGLAKKVGSIVTQRDCHTELADIWEKLKDPARALYHYRQFEHLKDSISNDVKLQEMTSMQMSYQFDRTRLADSLRYNMEKEAALAKKESALQQERYIKYGALFSLVFVLAVALLLWKGYRDKKNLSRSLEIQKNIVETKNKAIMDSIAYARHLQSAILPPDQLLHRYFPESFVLYKPKDIVAGDFYWFETVGDWQFIAAADCTGHGVPGAMVSVVCSNALDRTVKEFGILEPGKILDKVCELVVLSYSKSGNELNDGMDISLAAWNPRTGELRWAGANNPLWYVSNGELHEIKPDKQPIGKYDIQRPFSTHALRMEKGAVFYLPTDGFADQFGGPKGKKYKYRQLKEKLLACSNRILAEQRQVLDEAFESWKGDFEQVDDVCLIGIRV